MRLFITGGSGFIGSNAVRYAMEQGHKVLNFDKLTYAANETTLDEFQSNRNYSFFHGDICNAAEVTTALKQFRPDAVLHFAAESHVDRSIEGPATFINTNINGTYVLLESSAAYWAQCGHTEQFRFLHVSTDEVYGSLQLEEDRKFTETTRYDPTSPYSASKAASDHLVRAWHHTYNFPALLTNCSNNYGPFQFPEKLIPLMIINGIQQKRLPIYGTGENVRDWLHVRDHVTGLFRVLADGQLGHTYNIGGQQEKTNLEIVQAICDILDSRQNNGEKTHHRLIEYVQDRPGHDLRYAVNASKIRDELGWLPTVGFDEGLLQTVNWYVENSKWWLPHIEKRLAK
jgi:dTDP-glucose 4,6-dehydratase